MPLTLSNKKCAFKKTVWQFKQIFEVSFCEALLGTANGSFHLPLTKILIRQFFLTQISSYTKKIIQNFSTTSIYFSVRSYNVNLLFDKIRQWLCSLRVCWLKVWKFMYQTMTFAICAGKRTLSEMCPILHKKVLESIGFHKQLNNQNYPFI